MAVEFFPQGLNAAIGRSFLVSLPKVAADADAAGGDEAGAIVEPTGPTSAVLKPTGIGAIFEEGAKAHDETGTKGYLFINGSFVSGTIHHPAIAPKPYLGPAALRWANGGYQASARATLAESGF